MNTPDYSIDDLLNVVGHELRAYYEKNLGGRTLRQINDEYKTVKWDPEELVVFWGRLVLISMGVGLLLFLVTANISESATYSFVALFSVPCPVLFIYSLLSRKVKKDREILQRCTPILQVFRSSVDALNPLGGTNWVYTETSIRDILLLLAVRVLEAEIKFDAVRLQKERRVFDVVTSGNWLQKCHDQLETVDEQAKKFGLMFKQRDLFEDAGKSFK